MKPNVSIIVPVYQAEQYLEECVNSILQQTYKELEIILVDDGSTDQSAQICDAFSLKYDIVRVIHKANAGLTAAWKTGVLEAKGEYIGFVDSDDKIDSDMYERLYKEAKETKADIVCCGIRHVFEDHSHVDWEDQMQFPEEVYTKEKMKQEVYPCFINDGSFMGRGLQPNRVSKLIKRTLVFNNMNLCDNRVTVGEDYQFSFAMFLEAEKVAIIKDFLPYYYRINAASMTGRYDDTYMDKIKLMKQQLLHINDMKRKYDFSTQIWNDFLCLTVLHIKGGVIAHKNQGYRKVRKNIKRVCNDTEVRVALERYQMPKLTFAEKIFLFFIKHHMYACIYMVIVIYFK